MRFAWKKPASPRNEVSPAGTPRRSKRMEFSWDNLEERQVLSHGGALHHLHAAAAHVASTTSTSTSTTSTSTSTSSSNSTLATARQTLQNDIQTVEMASGTTIGELTAIHAAFATLKTDGLTPSSQSALSTYEDGLVTMYASGGASAITGNATLLSDFEALYTSSPTTQETTDLTTAYNALTAAVASSGITEANITTISGDFAAVLASESSTSTATFPYFTLVTGQAGHSGPGGFGGPGMGGGCH